MGHISKASADPVERAEATMRCGSGQGSAGRAFNVDRVNRGGKARSKHAPRADDVDPSLERMLEVCNEAFTFAQHGRSKGGQTSGPINGDAYTL